MIEDLINTEVSRELKISIRQSIYKMLADLEEVLNHDSNISSIKRKKIISEIQDIMELTLAACDRVVSKNL